MWHSWVRKNLQMIKAYGVDGLSPLVPVSALISFPYSWIRQHKSLNSSLEQIRHQTQLVAGLATCTVFLCNALFFTSLDSFLPRTGIAPNNGHCTLLRNDDRKSITEIKTKTNFKSKLFECKRYNSQPVSSLPCRSPVVFPAFPTI